MPSPFSSMSSATGGVAPVHQHLCQHHIQVQHTTQLLCLSTKTFKKQIKNFRHSFGRRSSLKQEGNSIGTVCLSLVHSVFFLIEGTWSKLTIARLRSNAGCPWNNLSGKRGEGRESDGEPSEWTLEFLWRF